MNYYIVTYEFGQYIQVGGSNSAVHTDVLPVVLLTKHLIRVLSVYPANNGF